jgi:hypothetical protein
MYLIKREHNKRSQTEPDMNTMTKAHLIRRMAAKKWNCKVSEIHFGECLRMAHKNEEIEMGTDISMTSNQGQKFNFTVASGKIVEATVETARGTLSIINPAMTTSGKVILSGRVADLEGKKKRVMVEFSSTAVRDELAATKPAEIKPEDIITGLAELKAAAATYNREENAAAQVMESGSSVFNKRTINTKDLDNLKAKYPAAAQYLRAVNYMTASNDKKSTAGIKAAKMLMSGASAVDAANIMDNWI